MVVFGLRLPPVDFNTTAAVVVLSVVDAAASPLPRTDRRAVVAVTVDDFGAAGCSSPKVMNRDVTIVPEVAVVRVPIGFGATLGRIRLVDASRPAPTVTPSA